MVETGGDRRLSDRLRCTTAMGFRHQGPFILSGGESNTSEHWPESTRTLDTNRVRSRSSGAEATHAARRRGPSCSQSQRATCSGTRTRTRQRLARGGGRVGTLCVKQYSSDPACDGMVCLYGAAAAAAAMHTPGDAAAMRCVALMPVQCCIVMPDVDECPVISDPSHGHPVYTYAHRHAPSVCPSSQSITVITIAHYQCSTVEPLRYYP